MILTLFSLELLKKPFVVLTLKGKAAFMVNPNDEQQFDWFLAGVKGWDEDAKKCDLARH